MFRISVKYFLVFMLLFIIGCAKRGTITGGEQDTLAPVLTSSLPKNFSVNFSGKEVKLYFDEYIKLNDINKQLIVSPPMETPPDISPTGASRYISIKIKDTLKSNTTYSFNFGQSIQDNNEGNAYQQFKYVFSTGNYIDSLSVEGTLKDALEQKADNFVTVMLYEKNEKYSDSTVYKEKPNYVTSTLDSLKTWKIENVKAGKYVLIALKDFSNNFKFDPKKDKIGFLKQEITVPSEEKYELKLFQEKTVSKILKPSQASGNRAFVGYEGDAKNIKIVLKNGNEVLPSIVTKVDKKDSVQVWFNKIKVDSLKMEITKDDFKKDFYFKMKDQKKDTLAFTASNNGVIGFRDTFSISTATPIVKFDNSKISVVDKDKKAVAFSTEYDAFNQKLNFKFKKEEEQKYVVQLLPGAMTDFFEKQNDTLNYKFSTKSNAEYGNMTLTLEKAKRFPIIVELTDEKGKVLVSEYAESKPIVRFEGLEPNKYYLRIIYDDNKNREWDPGKFLEKQQPEEVIYYPKEILFRANWDDRTTFILGD